MGSGLRLVSGALPDVDFILIFSPPLTLLSGLGGGVRIGRLEKEGGVEVGGRRWMVGTITRFVILFAHQAD